MSAAATTGRPPTPGAPGPGQPDRGRPGPAGWLRDLARAAAAPVACAVVLTGLLSAWVATGGTGNIAPLRIQLSQAAVPMRAYPGATARPVRAGRHLPDDLESDQHPGRAALGAQPGRAAHRAAAQQRAGGPGLGGGRADDPGRSPVSRSPRSATTWCCEDPVRFESDSTRAADPDLPARRAGHGGRGRDRTRHALTRPGIRGCRLTTVRSCRLAVPALLTGPRSDTVNHGGWRTPCPG